MRPSPLEHPLTQPEGVYADSAPIVPDPDMIASVLGSRLVGSTKELADSYNRSPKRIGESGVVQYDDRTAGLSTLVYIGEQAANARPDSSHITTMQGDVYLSRSNRFWSDVTNNDRVSDSVKIWANAEEGMAQLSPVTSANRSYESKGFLAFLASRRRPQMIQSLGAFTDWTINHPHAITLRRNRPVTAVVDATISESETESIRGFETTPIPQDDGTYKTQVTIDSATLASHLLSNDHDPSGLLVSGLGDQFYELAAYEHTINACEARLQEPQNNTPQDEVERAVAGQMLNSASQELAASSHALIVKWQERNARYEAAKRETRIRAVFANVVAELARTAQWHPQSDMLLQPLINDVAALSARLDPADADSLRTMQRLSSQLQGSLTKISDPNGLEALRVQLESMLNTKAPAIEAPSASDSQPDSAEF